MKAIAKHPVRTRIKLRIFMEGTKIYSAWVVEVRQQDGEWLPFGRTRKGITKHETKEAAIAAAIIIKTKLKAEAV